MNLLNSILFGIIYTVGYVFLTLLSTGGGHVNFFTLALIPPWIFNFVALFLLRRLPTRFMKIFFVILMAVYYLIVILILVNGVYDKDARINAPNLVIPIVWFISGQLIIWTIFIRNIYNPKTDNISDK